MSLCYFLKSKHRKYNVSLKMLDWKNQQTVGLQRQRRGISIEGNDHVSSFAIRKCYHVLSVTYPWLSYFLWNVLWNLHPVPIENHGIFQGPWGAVWWFAYGKWCLSRSHTVSHYPRVSYQWIIVIQVHIFK